ncbi:MAG: AI-2E family transporter [Candidatus Woykebacteria bacterium]
MNKNLVIEVSPKSIFTTITILGFLLVAWKLKGIIFALIISVILMSGFSPLVDWFEKKGINKVVAVALTYVIAIGTLGLILFIILPPLIIQTREFFQDLPFYITTVSENLNNNQQFTAINSEDIAKILSSRIEGILSEALGIILNVFTGFLTFITVAVFTFYLLLEKDRIKKNVHVLFPHLPKERVTSVVHKIDEKLGAWLRGQFALMVIIGIMSWVGLSLLRVDFALPLAVLAGLFEIISVIGPILASVPAIIIALVQYGSPIPALGVAALYILVQQLENNLIVPKVMEKAVGVHPLAIILAILIGSSLFGIMGVVLAVPIAATIQVIVEDIHNHSD